MRRRLDRIRFRSTARREDEPGDHGDSPNLSDGESVSEDGTSELAGPLTFGSIRESEELRDPACVGTPTLLGPVPDAMRTESDKLNEVKGHLELALLEKHFLQEELRRLREEPGLEQIRQDLERERCRCQELEANLEATSHSSRNEDKALCGERRDVVDGYKEEACCSWVTRIRTVGLAWLGELYQLLQPLTETKRDDTEEPLSAKRLTENMRRVKRAAKPLTNFLRDLTALSHWYSFYTSTLAFLVFGYAVWHGWALSLLLFLGIVRLSLNYLIARGWRIRWSIVPEVTEAEEPMKMDLTMSEKFQLVLDVAQKAQNLFGKLADILEKLKNLLMWIEEDATQTLYLMFWAAFLASCFLPAPLLGRIMGLIIAFRFFVVAPVFNRFPRVHLRYDTAHRLWNLLPTNQQLRERPPGLNSSRRNMGPMARSGSSPVLGGSDRGDDAIGSVPLSRKASFHETFSLPETEKPLPACENGWRCCLINRDKKISTDYIRNGLLYVTDNFICFESKSGPSKKNKVIHLQDITEIQKYKVLTMLPGSGMGISIKTPFTQKPLVFGAMVHRDEAYQTIMSRFSSLAQQPVQATPEAANLNITACS